jgi:hypothetical protein
MGPRIPPMLNRLRRSVWVLVTIALVAYSYAPILSAGFVGDDLRVLVGLGSGPGDLSGLYAVPETGARPLAALSLYLSAMLHAASDTWTGSEALALRLENLALLALAAYGLRRLLARAIRPWTGADQADAAGVAAGLLFLVHPLCVATVVRIGSRGDLLAIALGAWAVHSFLRARQERQPAWLVLTGVLAILAGLSSPHAIFLPLALAAVEYVSARRHRVRGVRLRTAGTTALLYGALVALEAFGRVAFAGSTPGSGDPRGLAAAPVPEGLAEAVGVGVEKLGVLLLPVGQGTFGVFGFVLAGAVLLFALQPAFTAARSAPRLWARILLGWLVSIAVAELPSAGVRVPPLALESAEVLLNGALVMGIALGIASTAVEGSRRRSLPWALALVYALIAHQAALPFAQAADDVAALQADLARARSDHPAAQHFFIVGSGTRCGGGLGARAAPTLLLDPIFGPSAGAAGADARELEWTALRAALRQPESEAWRARGLVVLVAAEGGARTSYMIPPLEPSTGPSFWRREGQSPSELEIDAVSTRAIRVRALPDTTPGAAPELHWTGSGDAAPQGVESGVWVSTEEGPVVWFDLTSLEWLVAGRVRSLWFPGQLTTLSIAEVLGDVLPLEGNPVPRRDRADWSFDLPATPPPTPFEARGRWVLSLLDLGSLAYREFPTSAGSDAQLEFPGVAAVVQRAQRRGAGPIEWSLEWRSGSQVLARAHNRRVALGGAEEE